MAHMPSIPRRVVTGHDERGVSVFASRRAGARGPQPRRTARCSTRSGRTGRDAGPVGAAEPTRRLSALAVPPAPNGTKIRINEFPPGVVSPVHRTQSVDYGIVLDGEVVLVLDDSETVLRAGDVVVQRGTTHRWENRTRRDGPDGVHPGRRRVHRGTARHARPATCSAGCCTIPHAPEA